MSCKKIFVGNVPFNCTKNEFNSTFKDIEGYQEGDIIINPKTMLCKGYGFIVFDTIENATNLKNRKDILILTRKLRFMDYYPNNLQYNAQYNAQYLTTYTKDKYIFVEGIPNRKTRIYLKEIFIGYELLGYYISTNTKTGSIKNHGRIELKYYEDYKKLLEKSLIEDNDGNILKLTKWN